MGISNRCYALVVALWLTVLPSLAEAHNNVVVVPLGGSEAKIETKTYTLNVPAAEFRRANGLSGHQGFFYDYGEYYKIANLSDSASAGITTGVFLPDGAEINTVTCYLLDSDSGHNAGFNSGLYFNRRSILSTDVELVLPLLPTLTTGSNTDMDVFSSSSITQPIINNDDYFYTFYYFIQLSNNAGGLVNGPVSSDVRFYGCSINYTLDVLVAE